MEWLIIVGIALFVLLVWLGIRLQIWIIKTALREYDEEKAKKNGPQ